MKTAEEWRTEYKAERRAFLDEKITERKLTFLNGDLIRAIQLDALKHAAQCCIEYASAMRGAHVNTNTSSSEIRRLILVKAQGLSKEVV